MKKINWTPLVIWLIGFLFTCGVNPWWGFCETTGQTMAGIAALLLIWPMFLGYWWLGQ